MHLKPKTEFVARWYLRKNDERTQFEYKDHDPTRLDTLSSRLHIDFVTLKFVPETKVFRLDAGTVEALDIAVKHHDDMDTPVESTLKKPAARKSKKPAARETASKRRRSARASREEEEEDDEGEEEQENEEDDEEREEEEDARLKARSTQQQQKSREGRARRRLRR